jgi:hypothetical protein
MRFSSFPLRRTFRCAVMLTAVGLSGCGNTCFVGFSNNGNGGVIVKAGNPPPTCSLSQANGTIRVLALKSSTCKSCVASDRVEHAIVTLQSIQLVRANDDTNSSDWLELAPHLRKEPLQIDLVDDSLPVILVENAIVPGGSYREVRLQFSPGSTTNSEEFPPENACGGIRWNCIVRADGHVEPVQLNGHAQVLSIPLQGVESNSLLVLPDAKLDLQLSLVLHHGVYFSSAEAWTPQNVLTGHATVLQQRSLETENSTPD